MKKEKSSGKHKKKEKNEEDVQEQAVPEESGDCSETAADLGEKLSAAQDRLLRKQAEFENFRKRMQREKQDAIRYANSGLLLDLLDVIDNLERAIHSSRSNSDAESLVSGVEMIEKQFKGMLADKWGLKQVDAEVGAEFDPNIHEAMFMEENGDYPVPSVLESLQCGYMLNDRVIRPSRVKVSKVAQNPSDAEEDNGSGGGGSEENA